MSSDMIITLSGVRFSAAYSRSMFRLARISTLSVMSMPR